jgi:pilus assembly protein CpaB
MPIRNLVSLAIAVLLGIVAVLMIQRYVSAPQKPGATASAGTSPVLVATVPIQRGAKVQPPMFRVVNYPSDAVPTGALTSISQVAGDHIALRSLAMNEPVLNAQLSGFGAKSNLSASLTPGMRALSIRINDATSVAGFALPGDRVDVLVTRAAGSGASGYMLTQILAQNVRLLGVDQISDDEGGKPVVSKAVTVETTPEEAKAIQLAQTLGTVSLTLRQLGDGADVDKRATTAADLGGEGRRAPVSHAEGGVRRKASSTAPARPEVRVTRGVESSSYPVAAD